MPNVTGFSPAVANQGDELRIRGTDLYPVSFVSIGGKFARVTYNSSDEVWVRVPSITADANPVSVEVGGSIATAPQALRKGDGGGRFGMPPGAQGIARGAMGAYQGAASSGRAVYGAASGVGGAVAGAGGQVFGAAASMGAQGLGAVLSPLGATGQGLAGIAGAGLQTGASFLSSGLQIGGTVAAGALGAGVGAAMFPLQLGGAALGMGGGLLSGLGGAVGGLGSATFGVASVAGGALGLGGAALSGLGSLASLATGAVTKIFETILQGAQSVVKVVGDGLGELGKLAGSVLSGILTVGQDVLSEARNYGRNIRNIGFQTGIGDARASSIANTYAFAGVSPQQLGGAFSSPQNTLSLELRARMLGLPSPTGDAQGFLMGGARMMNNARQGGLMGAMMFNAMAGPQITGTFGGAFDLGPERLQRNMNLAESFKLPGNMGNFSRDLDAFSIAVEALGRNLKLTLAEVLVPLMPAINQGFSWIIQNKDSIVGAVKTVGQWVTVELPQYILHGGAAILRVTSTVFDKVGTVLTDGFQKFMTGVIQNLPTTLKALDEFLNGMRSMASVTIGLGAAVSQYASNFLNSPTGKAVSAAMGVNPGATGATGQPGTSGQGNLPSPSMSPTQGVMPTGAGTSGGSSYSFSVLPPALRQNPNIAAWAGFWGGTAGATVDIGRAGISGGKVLYDVLTGNPSEAHKNLMDLGNQLSNPFATARDWAMRATQAGYYGTWDGSNPNSGGPGGHAVRAQAAARAIKAAGGAMPTSAQMQAAMAAQGQSGGTNPLLPQAGRDPSQAFQDAQQWFLNTVPQSNVQGSQQRISDILSSMQGAGGSLGDWMKDNAPGLRDKADTLDNWADSWKQQMLDAATRNADASEAVASHTDRTAQGIVDLLRAQPNLLKQIAARTSAIIAEDYAMSMLTV